jgi:hypothetical protein
MHFSGAAERTSPGHGLLGGAPRLEMSSIATRYHTCFQLSGSSRISQDPDPGQAKPLQEGIAIWIQKMVNIEEMSQENVVHDRI